MSPRRLVRLIVESGLLPKGALQFIAGSTGDLLDHLTGQDVLSFTGSLETSEKLRNHPTVSRNARPLHRRAGFAECRGAGAGRRRRDAGVRPVRQGSRARNDGEGRAEMHRHPPRLRARARSKAALVAALSPTRRVQCPAIPAGGTRMGALVSVSQRGGRDKCGASRSDRVRRAPKVELHRGGPTRAPSWRRCCCAPHPRGPARSRRRTLRPGRDGAGLRHARRRHDAGRQGQGPSRRLALHLRRAGRGSSCSARVRTMAGC